VPETLTVHLNREEPRDVAPEAASLETDRSFVLRFVNHGGPLHVHLHLDEALGAVARPSSTQVYVAEEATTDVEVAIPPGHDPVKGYVDLVTGYGAQEARLNVTVTAERKDGGPEVAVDETLAEKQSAETDAGDDHRGGPQPRPGGRRRGPGGRPRARRRRLAGPRSGRARPAGGRRRRSLPPLRLSPSGPSVVVLGVRRRPREAVFVHPLGAQEPRPVAVRALVDVRLADLVRAAVCDGPDDVLDLFLLGRRQLESVLAALLAFERDELPRRRDEQRTGLAAGELAVAARDVEFGVLVLVPLAALQTLRVDAAGLCGPSRASPSSCSTML